MLRRLPRWRPTRRLHLDVTSDDPERVRAVLLELVDRVELFGYFSSLM
jgi:hypothetical protein